MSAVVATRDRPHLLRRAVAAIVESDYPGDIEVLVVFDRTALQPLDVPESEGRRLRSLTNARSPGLAGARNTGILAASGEFVAFCDDDDVWLPEKLRRQIEALSEEPGIAVATTGITIRFRRIDHERVSPMRLVTQRQLIRSRAVELHPSTVLARRRVLLDEIGLVDEDIPGSYGEDYEWLLRASRLGPILAVQAPLVRVEWGEGSWFADRWTTMIEAIRYLLERHPELRSDPQGLARLYGRLAFAHAAAGDRPAARRWAREALRLHWGERRGYLALAVSTGLVRPATILELAHRMGRGI